MLFYVYVRIYFYVYIICYSIFSPILYDIEKERVSVSVSKSMKKVEEKKKERKLNKGQVATLQLLYRYRFTTSELLAKVEGKKHLQVTRSRLATLEKQGYIGRRYDSSYKLLGKFAAYYLLPKGLQYLKSIEVAEPQAIKIIYNDCKASDKFVDFCLQVCRMAQALISFYGDLTGNVRKRTLKPEPRYRV